MRIIKFNLGFIKLNGRIKKTEVKVDATETKRIKITITIVEITEEIIFIILDNIIITPTQTNCVTNIFLFVQLFVFVV